MDNRRSCEMNQQDSRSYPDYTLRFNGARDIIVFHAYWEGQEAVADIVRLRGSHPISFMKMRHVGLALCGFGWFHEQLYPYPPVKDDCDCSTDDCHDCCKSKEESLLRFLACFPSLETFYVAGIPESTSGIIPYAFASGPPIVDANCLCPTQEGGKLVHTWPTVEAADACGWFVIYDERSTCPFPKFPAIESLRRFWRPHFPCYQALDHLEIKFIRHIQHSPTLGLNTCHCYDAAY